VPATILYEFGRPLSLFGRAPIPRAMKNIEENAVPESW
jgi:hypothetical protein